MENFARNNQKPDFTVQYYLTIFLDILGQREILREIKSLPTTPSGTDDLIEKLRATLGKVVLVREGFKNLFDGLNSHTPIVDQVPPQYCNEFLAARQSKAYFYGFSDSTIICVPLKGGDEFCTAMNGVFGSIVSTCGMGLISLAARIPLRGGLDVGIATEIEGKEIYGPALERAHFLESKKAQYPRFIVGEEFVNFIGTVLRQDCRTKFGEIAKLMAEKCSEIIIQDTDGSLMLDFLGKRVFETIGKEMDPKVVKSALEFVHSQHEEHSRSGNEKISERYSRLLGYFESRLKLWGI